MNTEVRKNNLVTFESENKRRIYDFIAKQNIDIFGVADLRKFKSGSSQIPLIAKPIISQFKYAIVIGCQFQKLGKGASGNKTALFLEEIAFKTMLYIIEKEKKSALIIHTEDEFIPGSRQGLVPLKALARESGIGWQGRSLLIVSPEYGPLHRLIAILTDMSLAADKPISNQCKNCYQCIEKCPSQALKISKFIRHPKKREDVVDINKCIGDSGCVVCIRTCPWYKKNNLTMHRQNPALYQ